MTNDQNETLIPVVERTLDNEAGFGEVDKSSEHINQSFADESPLGSHLTNVDKELTKLSNISSLFVKQTTNINYFDKSQDENYN